MENESRYLTPQINGKKRWIALIGIILVITIVSLFYWIINKGKVSTDDAQITADLVPITARTSGYVSHIYIDDNQKVPAGTLLVSLDRRDLTAKLNSAESSLLAQQAQTEALSSQSAIVKKSAPAGAEQASAGISVALAAVRAAQDQVTASRAQYLTAQANVQSARSAIGAAADNVELADAQVQSANASLAAAQSNVTAAQANAKKAANDHTRSKELFASGATSRQQLDAAEAADTSAQAALSAARDNVQNAKAAVNQAIARRKASANQLAQARSGLSAATHAASQAQAGIKAAQSAVSQANARLVQAQAQSSGAQTAPQQISASQAQQRVSAAQAKQARANLNNARLQLSYTSILSPVFGIVSQKSVQLGQYVQSGQMLMSVVPLKNVWVVANFKETQIRKMHPGDRATIDVDTYPGRTIKGRVESIGAATQASFSLLPSQNATGNYVKVVQRIPVKIVLDKPLPKGIVLRPGTNVTATVITN